MQKWVTISEKYLDYLREFDSRVPFSNYGKNKYKPFFGTLFEKDGLIYVASISHVQQRHISMKNALDFIKIYIPDGKFDRLVAVVNLRYMFPVPKDIIEELYYRDIAKHRSFSSDEEKSKYIDLLKKELASINTMNFEKKAKRLYLLKNDYPDSKISKQCIEFKLLEEKAKIY